MTRVRALGRVTGELLRYSVVHRSPWIPLVALLLAVLVLVLSAGQAAAPYTLYTLF